MSWQIAARNGECLCLIAKRVGLGDCAPLRALHENAAVVDRAIQPDEIVTVPGNKPGQRRGAPTGKRSQVVIPRRSPIKVQFVRHPANAAPSDADAIPAQRLRISRYPTNFTSYDYDENAAKFNQFADHLHRTFHARSDADPDAFSVEVVDANVGVQAAQLWLEPAPPANHAQWAGRFPDSIRTARGLLVDLDPSNVAGRFRSCYLRLVVDEDDRAARPHQTVLVSDTVDDGDPALEILDQRVVARYEYAQCPLAAGSRCLLGMTIATQPRGHSVATNVWILRKHATANPDTEDSDGVISFDDARRRILKNTRRIWAQDGIAFGDPRIRMLDPPSDMLAIGDPDGDRASPKGAQLSFAFTIEPYSWRSSLKSGYYTKTMQIAGGSTPRQTAHQIAAEIRAFNVDGLVTTVHGNSPKVGGVGHSADVMFSCPWGRLRFKELTLEQFQDPQQKVELVACNPQVLQIRSSIVDSHIGGPEQRLVYRSVTTDPAALNIFVAQSIGGATAQAICANLYLPLHLQAQPALRNCIAVPAGCMDDRLDIKPATLAHEIGHVLMDHAEHPSDTDLACGLLMTNVTSERTGVAETIGNYHTKRIPLVPTPWLYICGSAWGAQQAGWQDHGLGSIGLVKGHMYSMSARILTSGTVARTPR
jgi:hypothetical protein